MQQPQSTSGENDKLGVAAGNSIYRILMHSFTTEVIDPYEKHFGITPENLTQDNRNAIERNCWKTLQQTRGGLGHTFLSLPEGAESRILTDQTALQNDLLSELSCYQDLYSTSTNLNHSNYVRETLSLHALNHVIK
jgi:U3 small nucleolar RNA-associated protein 25